MSTPSDTLDDCSVAVVHGNYLERGGGEIVAEELARVFDAPLFFGFGDPELVADDVDATSLANDSVLSRLRGSKLVRDPLYWWRFRHLPELHDYDLVVQSGNEFGWYVPPEQQAIVRYLHSTPRTPFDRFPDKGDQLKESLYSEAARVLYGPTVAYPDVFCANSDLVARRAQRYWSVTDRTRVVYPPIPVQAYRAAADDLHGAREPVAPVPDEPYYLSISRLYPTKEIAAIVQAFSDHHPEKRLVIAGSGSDDYEQRLREIAGPNVTFAGYVDERAKHALYANAEATIFNARNEDFGMVPIESLASGTPVLGVRDGFTRYQIHDDVTGLLYDRGVESLAGAVRAFDRDGVRFDREQLMAVAAEFGVERFHDEMRAAAQDALERSRTTAKTDAYVTRAAQPSVDREQQVATTTGLNLENGIEEHR